MQFLQMVKHQKKLKQKQVEKLLMEMQYNLGIDHNLLQMLLLLLILFLMKLVVLLE